MSATYDETLPTDKDEARSLLGDNVVTPGTTTVAKPLRSDEHINAVIAKKGFYLGVAFIADGLVTQFAQQPVKLSESGSSIDMSAQIPAWQALASRMRTEAVRVSGLTGGTIALDFQESLDDCEEDV